MLTALPVPDAVSALTAAWASAYRALGGGRAAGVATADLLSGRASAFGEGMDAYRAAAAAEADAAAAAAAGSASARASSFLSKAKGKLKGGGGGAAGEGGGADGEAGSVAGSEAGGAKKANVFKRFGRAVREL